MTTKTHLARHLRSFDGLIIFNKEKDLNKYIEDGG